MVSEKVRVRFAPSPTGGLHLGGVRTALFNYLFAKNKGGDFILRTEDTDQTRFVQGAEEYIFNCLKWAGISPVESTQVGGLFGPYRQSERKDIYKKYALQLIENGNAYYAFDTPEELEVKRNENTNAHANFQYDHSTRMQMKNSLTLSKEETKQLIDKGEPYVIRIKVDPGENIEFTDLIRGDIKNESALVDDKVLLKADGMPTYHLAVVVDDFLMKITHVFRGEEWLPSAPIQVLLWKNLFGLENMPAWVHLPLILKPDGNGKLSKRDGDRLGFPVYAMDWTDANGETTKGFKENGFLPEAFVNLLAMIGWNDGTEQEIFSMDELIEKFSLDRVHKSGAKFDYEKAKWFNHQWIQKLDVENYFAEVKKIFTDRGIEINDDNLLKKVMNLIKDRCTLLPDFFDQGFYFFQDPKEIDAAAILPKWNEEKKNFFLEIINLFEKIEDWNAQNLETNFKEYATEKGIKVGELMLPLRIMLVGGKFGPGVFEIAEIIGKSSTIKRIEFALSKIGA